ncbi:helix-turn-helix transcriptional regulator [Maritimibacter sp. UBA3975]|uniref:helix-turn-helix domain-containing protein n=1 Tax=Maritimibacter sp. UBA3975 TaxID=1946833 RepID=UPI000C09F43D|nr:helix-turn-helix transcriptional regulator [Maritimibacter sp. UBA3975]MAM63865.1 transcriptional regulator [Maritimibacter sp.]|tara:strand:+ start:68113 stop:68379 length:267 start_codon:yes stop_codon:yes gene_type:complete
MGLRTVEQLRQARAALGWTQAKVAEAAGVSVPTIKRLENGSGNLAVRFETLNNLEAALTAQGIQFLDNGDTANGPGVALRPLHPAKPV